MFKWKFFLLCPTMRLIFSLLLLPVLFVRAQPNVTLSHLPVPGTVSYVSFSSQNEPWDGTSGANQTWDFSDLSFSPGFPLTYQPAASLEGSNRFPAATMGYRLGENNWFLRSTATGLEMVGEFQTSISNPILASTTYQPPMTFFPLGLSFNQTRTTVSRRISFDSVDVNTATKTISSQKSEFTYVAWGSLTLPNASPIQVMVVKVTETTKDSLYTSTTGLTGDYTFTEVIENSELSPPVYMFLQAASPALVLTVSSFENVEGNFESSFVWFSSTAPTQVQNNRFAAPVQLYPNPGRKEDVVLTNLSDKAEAVWVFDSFGREVAKVSAKGQEHVVLPSHRFPPGVYSVRIGGGTLPAKSMKLVIEP